MPNVLDLGDRPAHQLGPQLGVVAVAVAADGFQLGRLGRHEQLEEELAVVRVQPVREDLQLAQLLGVLGGVAVGVVADEHLREVRVEREDVLAELVAVLEVEHVLARALGRHRELQPGLLGLLRDGRAELLVDQHAGDARFGAGADGLEHALEDQVLGVGDDRGLLVVRLALDPEELLLERAAVVEGEDVELVVVSEIHGHPVFQRPVGRCREVARRRRGRGDRPVEWAGGLRRRSVRRMQAMRF